jgi:hypothetical protein
MEVIDAYVWCTPVALARRRAMLATAHVRT